MKFPATLRGIRLGILAIIGWMVVVAGGGVYAAMREGNTIITKAQSFPEQVESLRFVIYIAVALVVPAYLVRAIRPRFTLPTILLVSAILATGFAFGAAAIADLTLLIWILFAWCETGRLTLGALRIARTDWLQRATLSAGIGAGLWALYGLGLGVLGFLNIATIIVPMALLLASIAWRHRRGVHTWRATLTRLSVVPRAPGWLETLLWCCLAFSLLLGYCMALAPELMSDAYRVHLALARTYAESQRVTAIANQAQSYQPIHGQILFTIGTVLHGQILAKLVHTLTGVLAVIGVGLLARHGAGRQAGLLAATLFAMTPVMMWEAGTAYTDAFVVLYVVLALLALLLWQRSGRAAWALILGALIGFGLAAKLSFAFVTVALMLTIFVVGRRGGSVLGRVGAGCLVALGAIMTSSGWLLRTYLLTGTIPGLSLITAVLGLYSGRGDTAETLANLPGFGIGSSLRSLVILPYEITVRSALFGENPNGFLGFGFLLLLPFAPLALIRPNRTVITLLIVTVTTYLAWFYSAQYIRYLLPTLASLAALISIGVARFGAVLGIGAHAIRRQLHDGTRLIACGIIATSAVFYLATILIYPGAIPVRLISGDQSPQEYLASRIAMYDTLQHLDQLVPPGTPVAVIPDGWQLYTHARLFTAFNGAPDLIWAPTAEAAVRALLKQNITYIVFYPAAVSPTWVNFPLLRPGALQPYADIVYNARGVTLYRLRAPGTADAPQGAELLRNPGFEQGAATPTDWVAIGTPEYRIDGSRAHSGQRGVLATTQTGFHQQVAVEADKPYILSYYARADQGGCQARLQINWLDTNKQFVTTSIDVVNVGDDWGPQTMWVTAPPNATTGLVYISTHLDSRCWFDDYSFRPAP
jgi:4-amino-4-deoxy-L-arabinose transferase-like glycosyltransferase